VPGGRVGAVYGERAVGDVESRYEVFGRFEKSPGDRAAPIDNPQFGEQRSGLIAENAGGRYGEHSEPAGMKLNILHDRGRLAAELQCLEIKRLGHQSSITNEQQ